MGHPVRIHPIYTISTLRIHNIYTKYPHYLQNIYTIYTINTLSTQYLYYLHNIYTICTVSAHLVEVGEVVVLVQHLLCCPLGPGHRQLGVLATLLSSIPHLSRFLLDLTSAFRSLSPITTAVFLVWGRNVKRPCTMHSIYNAYLVYKKYLILDLLFSGLSLVANLYLLL